MVDPAYSRLLIQKTDLPLTDVLALDRVQKKLPIPNEAAAGLRRAGLIEGRKPNYHVSAQMAAATDQKVDYIRTRAQDDEFYAKLLMDYLQRYGSATRAEINKLLVPKLSEALSAEQKENKLANLLTPTASDGPECTHREPGAACPMRFQVGLTPYLAHRRGRQPRGLGHRARRLRKIEETKIACAQKFFLTS